MRVLRSLLVSLFVFLILASGVFLIVREVFITVGTATLKSSLREVSNIAHDTGYYVQECRKKGIVELDQSVIKAIQLRFVSDTEYKVEVVCRQFSLAPIVASEGKLPSFVTKEAGSGGITWGEDGSGVVLSSFGRKKGVFIEDDLVKIGDPDLVNQTMGPITSCTGHGYFCCPAETSLGVGSQFPYVTDCSKTCFESCELRPVILSFSTQPFFDVSTRVLRINKGEQVQFAFNLDPAGSESVVTTIDFGDGQKENFEGSNGSFIHSYRCSQSQCVYNVAITATNQDNVSSVQTPISKVRVIVQ